MALGHILLNSISRNEHIDTYTTRPPASLTKNLNRLLSAAVVSPRFQQLLLSDPASAVAVGCNGEKFHLTPAEYTAVMSVVHPAGKPSSIREFAAQLIRIYQAETTESMAYTPEIQTDFRLAELAVG